MCTTNPFGVPFGATATDNSIQPVSEQHMQFIQWRAHQQFLLLKENQKWKRYCQNRNINYSYFDGGAGGEQEVVSVPKTKHAAIQAKLSQTSLPISSVSSRDKYQKAVLDQTRKPAGNSENIKERDPLEEIKKAMRDVQLDVRQLKLGTYTDETRGPVSGHSKVTPKTTSKSSLRSEILSSIARYSSDKEQKKNVHFEENVKEGASTKTPHKRSSLKKAKVTKRKPSPVKKLHVQQIQTEAATSQPEERIAEDAQKKHRPYIRSIESMIKRLDEIQESQDPIWDKWKDRIKGREEENAASSAYPTLKDLSASNLTITLNDPVLPLSHLPNIMEPNTVPKRISSLIAHHSKEPVSQRDTTAFPSEQKTFEEISAQEKIQREVPRRSQIPESNASFPWANIEKMMDELMTGCLGEYSKEMENVVNSIIADCYNDEFVP